MRRSFLSVFIVILIASTAWTIRYFRSHKRLTQTPIQSATLVSSATITDWTAAVEKVKADRGESLGGGEPVTTPTELKHYSERYWFLATQIAEVAQHNIPTCHDYFDLASMLQRGE